MQKHKLLILGGTGDAATLARRIVLDLSEKCETIISYSGVTGHQPDLPCAVHVGGFGGAEGLITYLKDEGFTHVLDATHPFADQISQHAYIATNALKLPHLCLSRPAWTPQPSDRWLVVGDMRGAVEKVAELGAKTFLTIGIKELSAFDGLDNVSFLVRLVHHPDQTLPLKNYAATLGRPPYDLETERQLLREHDIRLMVTKNSGGAQTYAKIEAARLEKVPVIMIERPAPEPVETLQSIETALEWLKIRMT